MRYISSLIRMNIQFDKLIYYCVRDDHILHPVFVSPNNDNYSDNSSSIDDDDDENDDGYDDSNNNNT